MEYIRIGNIVNTFGIRGELKVRSFTDFPELRFAVDNTVYILYQKQYLPMVISSYREHKGFVLVQFKEHENINYVEKYKECDIYINKEDIPMLNDGYYYFQLKGCDVYYDNQCIGKVSSVENGYQSILRIQTGHKEVLIPYVDAFIKNVNIDKKRIDVNVIEGML